MSTYKLPCRCKNCLHTWTEEITKGVVVEAGRVFGSGLRYGWPPTTIYCPSCGCDTAEKNEWKKP